MSDDRRPTRGPSLGGRVEHGERLSELERLRPFLELAREIEREVARVAADDDAGVESLVEAIDLVPRRERQRIALAVFERLPPEAQWSVLERAWGDEEIAAYLEEERSARLAELRRSGARRAVVAAARAAHGLDSRAVPVGEHLTLGLFREPDVGAALRRGHRSDACPRQLVLRSTAPGVFRVIEDVFNPRRGYFVTAAYDERTWRGERLAGHASVRVGSIDDGPSGPSLEPVLYPGARADFEVNGAMVRGQLHLGVVMLGDVDVFAP